MKICAQCGRSYASEASVCAHDGRPLSSLDAGGLKRGDRLGQYRIISEIGQGGMGVIYSAQHVRLGRQVALKVLKPGLVGHPHVVQRFFTEARAVNEIRHPNIADVFDLVEDAAQSPPLVYMVMELLAGEDLGRRLSRDGPLHPKLAAAIADQIAEALTATHRMHILHRDLKPENVFLVRTAAELAGAEPSATVKLLDFGVARAFGERRREDVTDPGSPVGTPAYMAPEQVLHGELDERTDVYALGVLLYEMLSGGIPFAAPNHAELMRKHVKEQPVPLSWRRTREPPVPRALEKLVMTCLEKEPARRFQNMTELRAALAAMRPSPPDVTESAPPVPPRRRSVQIALAVVALAASAVAARVLFLGPRDTPSAPPGAGVLTRGLVRQPDATVDLRLGAPERPAVWTAAGADGAEPDGTGRAGKRPLSRRPSKHIHVHGREATVDPFEL